MSLNSRIKELENQVVNLTALIDQMQKDKVSTTTKETTKFGGGKEIDSGTGLGTVYGGPVIWNDTEAITGRGGSTQPPIPAVGFNKHTHTRFSGGALIKNAVEVIELEPFPTNPHSQGFLNFDNSPKVKKAQNTDGESVDKIGIIDFVFDPDTLKWGCPAYEIDVLKCSLVMRDQNGDIDVDGRGQPMSSPLFNVDPYKTSVVWDTNGACWRFYAVYAGA